MNRSKRQALTVSLFLFAGARVWAAPPKDVAPAPSKAGEILSEENESRTELVRGRVVWLHEVLKSDFGISTVPEAADRILAMQTEKGDLLPIAEDLRGRSFRSDARLMGKPMELMVRRSEKHPFLQVIRTYEMQDGRKYQIDYWCDVCAIVMFEKGFCACCQDNNRLRKTLVKEVKAKANSDG